MHLLSSLPYAEVGLIWDRSLTGKVETRTKQLRGALASAFAENDLFHQHTPDGHLLYRYPRVQYRWRKGQGLIAAWSDAAAALLTVPWLDLPLRLGQDEVRIRDAVMSTRRADFGIGQRLLHYRTMRPILLFNQDNYRRFMDYDGEKQLLECDRLLVAQILGALRALEIKFDAQLYATWQGFQSVPCPYKGQTLLGIRGEFISNAVLPDGFAFGHAVSHGFGWVEMATIDRRRLNEE